MDFKEIKEKAISALSNSSLNQLVRNLYGMIEQKHQKIIVLEEENRKLQNLIRKQNGEQELPEFKENTKSDDDSNDDDDSFGPPNVPKNKTGNRGKRGEKLSKIKVDRNINLPKLDKKDLPDDAIYKGTRTKTIQNIILKTDNVQLIIHRWYSPSQKKYFESEIPLEYQSEYGANLRAFIITLATQMRTTEPLIKKLLTSFNIFISTGQISNILQKITPELKTEFNQSCLEAMNKCKIAQIDWTGTPIKGIAGYTTALVNKLFSFFRHSFTKERFQAMSALNFGAEVYQISEKSIDWFVNRAGINVRGIFDIKKLIGRKISSSDELYLLARELANKNQWNKITFNHFMASTLVTELSTDLYRKIVLISDDAKEYRLILDQHQLCWVHEIRHYKTILMFTEFGQEIMKSFWDKTWALWDLMESFKENPTIELKIKIQNDFKNIFETDWNFAPIDNLRKNTLERKKFLFEFLNHPELKLSTHNNLCENGIRAKVIKRKISYGHRSSAGATNANFWLGLLQTVEKNKLSFFEFLVDRFSGVGIIQSLPSVIANTSIF